MADIGEIPMEGGGVSEEEEFFFMKLGFIVMLSMISIFIMAASYIEHTKFGYTIMSFIYFPNYHDRLNFVRE